MRSTERYTVLRAVCANVTKVEAHGHTHRQARALAAPICTHHVPQHEEALLTEAPTRKPITFSICPMAFFYICPSFPLHFSSPSPSHHSTIIFLSSYLLTPSLLIPHILISHPLLSLFVSSVGLHRAIITMPPIYLQLIIFHLL